jgi:hypothetical protein
MEKFGGRRHSNLCTNLNSETRKHLENLRDEELYNKLKETGPKEVDPTANFSREELKIHNLNLGVREIEKMMDQERKFLKFLRKKAELIE